ncbi:MAG TPA: YjjG family noncanonical pyrimidine nucleotidase [Archangium sp.]|uniref:YjjG family noncanonical pyrimidine nucleotidase n=1 Tax=Archangium sp. TaxID=1872627 RepID=UPI002E312058|nr:YjjG family noncanonical pyrimidine nucleotidase [Archangium sp.]HEX5746823.1 YjjG family noncanonical pyrimidine nucleotidase [Archangium sp.]
MSYELILFDADDTLFDFRRAERHAFEAMLAEVLRERPTAGPLEEVYGLYQRINQRVWEELEQGVLPKARLNAERFHRLWKALGLEVDVEHSGARYVAHLSRCSFLLEDALEACVRLRQELGCRVGIVTNGLSQVQRSRLECSALAPWVDFMVVSEECGHAKPDPRIFAYTFERHPHAAPEATLFIGDRLEADVQGANAFGLDSCWFNPERRPNPTPIRPKYEIHALRQVCELVARGR